MHISGEIIQIKARIKTKKNKCFCAINVFEILLLYIISSETPNNTVSSLLDD